MTELPMGWRHAKLEDVATVTMGQSPPGSSYNTDGIGKPFFQGKAEFGDTHPTVAKWTTSGTKFARPGDILMSVRAPVGPTNVADVDCVIGRGLAAITADPATVSQQYLIWVIKHLESEIASQGKGSTFDSISGVDLRGTLLPVPPLIEQKRIVDILEEQLSRLEATKLNTKKLELKTKSFQTSFLNAVIKGDYSQESKSWELTSFRDLGTWVGGGTPSKSKTEFWKNGSIPWLTPKDMKHEVITVTEDKITDSAVNESSTKLIKGPSLAMVVRSGILAHSLPIALVPFDCTLNQDMKALIQRQDISLNWVAWSMRAREQQLLDNCRKAGTTVASLDMTKFYEQKLKVPPMSEQLRLIGLIEAQTSGARLILGTTQSLRQRSQSLRHSLLHAAFTGQLTKEPENV